MNDFEKFKAVSLEVLSHSQNCEQSQRDFAACTTYQQMARVWFYYIDGIMREIPEQFLKAFPPFYEKYKESFNAAGLYFNEDSSQGIIIVGGIDEKLVIHGSGMVAVRVYIIGKCDVVLNGNVRSICVSADAKVELRGHSQCTAEKGHIVAKDFSRVTAKEEVTIECYNASDIKVTRDTNFIDHGHRNLTIV